MDVETLSRPRGRIPSIWPLERRERVKPGRRRSKGPKPTRRAPLSEPSALARTPPALNLVNRRIRTRTYGGVGGGSREVSPYPDFPERPQRSEDQEGMTAWEPSGPHRQSATSFARAIDSTGA
jgi:hypothetical protein